MRNLLRILGMVAALGVPAAQGAGLPEPGVILYGSVHENPSSPPITEGVLEFVLQPSGNGLPVIAAVPLSDVMGEYSYVVVLPAEAPLLGESISSNTVQLGSAPTAYQVTQVQLDGLPASVDPAGSSTLAVSAMDRGAALRIDVLVQVGGDADQNGLPDDWEMDFFGQTGVDPNGDPDQDGMSTWQEWKAGTDPMSWASKLGFMDLAVQPGVGISLQWSSETGRSYAVERSEDLTAGFLPLAAGLPATAPVNTSFDGTATGDGPYFYRILVEQ